MDKTIDFDKIKWGSFTKQYEKYHATHPKCKSLEQFARYIIKHESEFNEHTLKRALFYIHVIKKK
jgi:hypothetical protein